jgi:PKD domain
VPGVLRPIALAAVIVVAFASPAAAAGWLSPVDLSPASGSSASSSVVASDTPGESFAAWVDSDGTNTRVFLSAHAPGLGWSVATPLSDAGQSAGAPVLALRSNGFGAIAWTRSDGAKIRVEVSRRAPGGAFGAPVIISAPGVDSSNPVVGVDRSGDVQVAWIDPSNNVLQTRRYTASSAMWDPSITPLTSPVTPANQILFYPTLAMSPTGTATIAWAFDTDPGASPATALNVQSRTQDIGGAWLTMVSHTTNVSPSASGRPQLAVADDGTVTLVWMDYTLTCVFLSCSFTTGVVREQTRTPAGSWGTADTLSDPTLISDNPTVATTPAGETTVVWTEAAAKAIKALTRTVGGGFPVASAATIITPQDQAIASGNFIGFLLSSVHITSTASGSVVTFGRSDGPNTLASAVFRPAGGLWPNPILTPPAVLSAPGADAGLDGLFAGIDGLGNIVTSWTRAGVIQTSTYDVSPPAFTSVDVPATGTTGQPVAMSSTTFDTWSAVSTSWTFGDGGAGAGPSVSHVFATPGTYLVTVGATDLGRNTATPATRQIVISNPPVPPLPTTTVAKPKVKLTWKSGKLSNSSITVTGTVGAPASLTITVTLHGGKKTAVKSTFSANSGAWSRTLKLPATLSPGKYDVRVTGPVVQSSATSFTVAAPASGIVKRSYATGPRRGPAVTSIAHTSELWAHFQFAFLPRKGQKITTQWILPGGKRLAANSRPRTSLVEAQVKDLTGKTLPTGRWRCVITVGKTVLATLNVRLK